MRWLQIAVVMTLMFGGVAIPTLAPVTGPAVVEARPRRIFVGGPRYYGGPVAVWYRRPTFYFGGGFATLVVVILLISFFRRY